MGDRKREYGSSGPSGHRCPLEEHAMSWLVEQAPEKKPDVGCILAISTRLRPPCAMSTPQHRLNSYGFGDHFSGKDPHHER